MEMDWSELYKDAKLDPVQYYNEKKKRWEVDFDQWNTLVRQYRPQCARLLDDGIDILIATDCLSEGQNLQDADMQINYDIHWNPVRLIQRFGRIDRIGSPNKVITGVNFWPAKSFEAYLQLETRIQNRMTIMKLVDTETVEIDENYKQMVADNPIQDKNADRLLEELTHNSISDIESPQALSLKDFSFETYRQDLQDYYEKQQDFYRRMPNGIFSGFRNGSEAFANVPESLVALVGYPKKPEGKKDFQYSELYLMCQPVNADPTFKEINKAEVLEFLRQNKKADRYVPQWLADNDTERISQLSEVLKAWMRVKAPAVAISNIKDKLKSKKLATPSAATPDKKQQLQEKKFQIENFDLIVWEYVSATDNN